MHDRATGALTDGLGRRALVAPIGWLIAWQQALQKETGDAAAGILNSVGSAWGAADMAGFVSRAPDEFGEDLAKVHMAVALQTWWWPYIAGGWGSARFDFGRPAQRWIGIEVTDSAVARAARKASSPVCHLYAGLFAGALGRLSGRALTGVEIQCQACDGGHCRLIVTTEARAATVRDWQHNGVRADEIETRLAGAGR